MTRLIIRNPQPKLVKPGEDKTIIVDATKQILGRLASNTAKILLREPNTNIIIINAEKSVVTGSKEFLIAKYKRRAELRTNTYPMAGPFYPRSPDQLVKRTVRGMLPWKRKRGREAYQRLKVFIGAPADIDTTNTTHFDNADGTNLKSRHCTIGDLSVRIGSTYLSKPEE